MARKKPPCADVIVATVKTLRTERKDRSAPSGVRLSALWNTVSPLYTSAEFEAALNDLIAAGTVLVIAEHHSETAYMLDPVGLRISSSTYSDKLILAIPAREISENYDRWYVDSQRQIHHVSEEITESGVYDFFGTPLIYITADNPPKRALKATGSDKSTLLKGIVAKTKKST